MADHRLDIEDAHAHRLRLTLKLARPAREQRLALAAWAPGSYLLRDFARHVVQISAQQGERPVALEQVDKSSWLARCEGRGALVVTLIVYAFDDSVRGAFVDAQRAFVNGPAVFLRAVGREAEPQRLTLGPLPRGWDVATALRRTGPRRYEAADHAELIDHPIALGPCWRGRFDAGGAAHEIALSGAWPGFDGTRLVDDLRRICEAQVRFWHGAKGRPPFERYLFLVHASEDGYGGLEHRASTAISCARRHLPRHGMAEAGDGYLGLLALLSHEYFHAWNVVRMRPAELAAPDLQAEAYTRLLWFYEGVTSYYDELMLLRAGLVDPARYLQLLARPINAMLATPGRRWQSLAQASFEAWTRFYKRHEGSANSNVSYYDKGSVVALLADLALRARGRSLDEVMRTLWKRAARGPVGEAEIVHALGPEVAPEVMAWVHGTDELPLSARLAAAGIALRSAEPGFAARVGLKLSEGALSGVQVRQVLGGSAAEAAGMSPNDEVIGVAGWRVRRFDEALQWVDPAKPFDVLVARDQRLHTLTLRAPAAPLPGTLSLRPDERAAGAALALRQAWLGD